MVADLNLKLSIKVMPIVREGNGLAMSSRNDYLKLQQKEDAQVLYKALKRAKEMIKSSSICK